ncbi:MULTISPECIES: hypothetical protein, partial [unclassified Vibrio]
MSKSGFAHQYNVQYYSTDIFMFCLFLVSAKFTTTPFSNKISIVCVVISDVVFIVKAWDEAPGQDHE